MNVIKRAMLFGGKAQVAVVDIREMIRDFAELHCLSSEQEQLVGGVLRLTAYLSLGLKNDTDRLSVVVEGVSCKIVTVAKQHSIKGFISGDILENNATVSIVTDLGMKQPYTTKTSVGELNLNANAFISTMPFCEEEFTIILNDTAQLLANDADKLDRLGAAGILDFYFGHMDIESLPDIFPKLECDCSLEKIDKLIDSLDPNEITAMIKEDGKIEVKCDFCGKRYIRQ